MRVLPRHAQHAAGSTGATASADALPTVHAAAVPSTAPGLRPLHASADGQMWMCDWLRDVHTGPANWLQRLWVDARRWHRL